MSNEQVSDSSAQAIKILAPIVTMGATWLVTRGLNAGYRSLTGNQPPKASDPSEPMRKVILWSLVTACAVTVVNIGVDRWVAHANATEAPTITA
jgi:hypothetical protein